MSITCCGLPRTIAINLNNPLQKVYPPTARAMPALVVACAVVRNPSRMGGTATHKSLFTAGFSRGACTYMNLIWNKWGGDKWCPFLTVNLDHSLFQSVEGVYIIWHGERVPGLFMLDKGQSPSGSRTIGWRRKFLDTAT